MTASKFQVATNLNEIVNYLYNPASEAQELVLATENNEPLIWLETRNGEVLAATENGSDSAERFVVATLDEHFDPEQSFAANLFAAVLRKVAARVNTQQYICFEN